MSKKGKKLYKMTGGPLDGVELWLSSPGTVAFRMYNQAGRYNSDNIWEPKK